MPYLIGKGRYVSETYPRSGVGGGAGPQGPQGAPGAQGPQGGQGLAFPDVAALAAFDAFRTATPGAGSMFTS
jgi:hypothetical protein